MTDAAETLTDKSAKDERRREILDAAFKEFSEKGYTGASMEAIARRARASKETLYAWFNNKETLFNTIFLLQQEAIGSRALPAGEDDPSPTNILPIVAEDLIRYFLAIAPLAGAFGEGGAGNKALPLMGKTISEQRQPFVDYVKWCRERDYIAFDDDPFEIASVFVAMAQGEWVLRLNTRMLEKLTDEMIKEHAQRVTKMFLRALAPDKKR